MTILPGCAGCRTVAVLASWTARHVKECIWAETGFPVSEQRLWLGDREVSAVPGAPRAGAGLLSAERVHISSLADGDTEWGYS